VQVRSLPGAPIFFAPFAKRSKASVLQTDISRVRILEGARACSSVEEPRADNAVTEVRFFTGTPLATNDKHGGNSMRNLCKPGRLAAAIDPAIGPGALNPNGEGAAF
jgi:hypothetical protein